MNCIPIRQLIPLALMVMMAYGVPAAELAPGSARYKLSYEVTLLPAENSATVELRLSQDDALLREMRFDADSSRFGDFFADGEFSRVDGRVTWSPPADGGLLRWTVTIARRREGDGYDAWLDESFGLFRAEDIIPRAATRTLIGARSDTSMRFALPDGWSVVSEYRKQGDQFHVHKAARRFAQPSGWIVAGHLGVRRDIIAATRVAIAAPEDHGVRRLDMLALLSWTMPELARIVPAMPARLTVVSAGEPMWRGALSGPQSLYIHASRPLISENGTSTLLHELVHVVLGVGADNGADWIVEGLAEYYSMQLLLRSGSLSKHRFERARERQLNWGRTAVSLCGESSTGATTALAVSVFAALDTEIQTTTERQKSLDDIVQAMLSSNELLSLDLLRSAAAAILGENSDALHIDKLPGCRTMTATR